MNKKLEKILNKSNFELDSLGTDKEDSISIDDAFDVLRRAFEAANKLILKYRPITDLTDDEVKQIVNEIYEPDSFIKIVRKADYDEVLVIVGDSDGYREHIHLRDPFRSGYGFQYDNCTYDYNHDEHEKMFEQFCVAKGVCYLLKDNPYLEAENEN